MTKYIIQSSGIKNFPEKLKKYNEEVFKDFIDKKENMPVRELKKLINRDIINIKEI